MWRPAFSDCFLWLSFVFLSLFLLLSLLLSLSRSLSLSLVLSFSLPPTPSLPPPPSLFLSICLSLQEAGYARDTLVRHVYGRLFVWLLEAINRDSGNRPTALWYSALSVCVCVCVCVHIATFSPICH